MKYTDAQAQKLRELYPSATWDELHKAFPPPRKAQSGAQPNITV